MPTFSPEQQAFIRELAYEIADIVIERHVHTCPWGQKMTRAFWLALGIGVGSGVLGVIGLKSLLF